MDSPEDAVRTGKNWIIDRVFDPNHGWPISTDQAVVTQSHNQSGHIIYNVKMDDINVQVWEIHRWKNSPERDVPAGRIAAKVQFKGIKVGPLDEFLRITYRTSGFPSVGIDDDGQPSLHMAFPISPSFPVDVARRQVMSSIGILVVEANDLLVLWRKNAAKRR